MCARGETEPAGHGTTHWLPWLTVAHLTPLVRLRDTFGNFDIDKIEMMPKAARLRREAAFSKSRGFARPVTARFKRASR